MNIAHLTSSRFHGGPERQMLGLAHHLPRPFQTLFLSFSEDGRCAEFLERAHADGIEAIELEKDTPHLWAAYRELCRIIRRRRIEILCCVGYKANLLGRLAAWKTGIRAMAIMRGWTGESWKVRQYEKLDRRVLRQMDKIVCVSESQRQRVIEAGAPTRKTVVIRNAISTERFTGRTHDAQTFRQRLEAFFPHPPRFIVGAAGRLSPEKGWDVLTNAAKDVTDTIPEIGFVVFGEGKQRKALENRLRQAKLGGRFELAGHTTEIDKFMPQFDLLVQSSYTEGLPNVLLEAFAAGVPVAATRAGGTSEVVEDGVCGRLVPVGDPSKLAAAILDLLGDEPQRKRFITKAKERVRKEFSFEAQANQYQRLFDSFRPASDAETSRRRELTSV